VWDDPTKSPPMTTTSPASPTARAGLKLLAFAVTARLGWRRRRRRRSVSCPSARSTQQRSRRAGRSGLLTLSRLAMTLARGSPPPPAALLSPIPMTALLLPESGFVRQPATGHEHPAIRRARCVVTAAQAGWPRRSATHPDATIVVRTVRDRLTAWVCGPQNPIQ
jgi:hypothetical protein